jgi:hypothetical protein
MFDLKYEQQKQQKIYQKYQIKQLNRINQMLNAKIIRIRNEEIKLLEEKEKFREIIQETPKEIIQEASKETIQEASKETIQEINKYNISSLPLEHHIAFIVNNIFTI